LNPSQMIISIRVDKHIQFLKYGIKNTFLIKYYFDISVSFKQFPHKYKNIK
jgi:hypothetical protein